MVTGILIAIVCLTASVISFFAARHDVENRRAQLKSEQEEKKALRARELANARDQGARTALEGLYRAESGGTLGDLAESMRQLAERLEAFRTREFH